MTLNEEIVLTCAFRYALGRMTYVVDSVASEIERNAGILPLKDLHLYVREIDEVNPESGLGMKMDAERWFKCRDILQAEINKRKGVK